MAYRFTMKQRVVAGIVAAVLSGLPVLVAVPADAAAGCVTKAEFGAVKVGWTKERVHRKFGTTGTRTVYSIHAGHAVEVRAYDACDLPGSNLMVSFDKPRYATMLRVKYKQAVWNG